MYFKGLVAVIIFGFFLSSCVNDSYKKYEPTTQKTSKTEPKESLNSSSASGFFSNYENTNRVAWQKPEMVIDLFGDLSGKTVADLGAGSGFFSLRLAEKAQKVIAIDIDEKYVSYLDSIRKIQLPTEIQDRLEPRLASPTDARLNREEIDALLIANTFMYLPDRINYLKNLRASMRPGGTILILDFKQKRTPLGPRVELRLPIYQVENELEEAGFVGIRANDTMLDYQFVVMAKAP